MTDLGFRFKQATSVPGRGETINKTRTCSCLPEDPAPPVMFRWEPADSSPARRAPRTPAALGARTLGLLATPHGSLVAASGLHLEERPNPLRQSMYLTSRSLGQTLDISIRHPRPIRFESETARFYAPAAALLLAGPDVGADGRAVAGRHLRQ